MIGMTEEQFNNMLRMLAGTMTNAAQEALTAAKGSSTPGDGDGREQRQRNQLNFKGLDGIDTFSGGEEQWGPWAWKMRVALGAMHPELVEELRAVE